MNNFKTGQVRISYTLALLIAVFAIQVRQAHAQSVTARTATVNDGANVTSGVSAANARAGGGQTIVLIGSATLSANYDLRAGPSGSIYGGLEAGPIVFKSDAPGLFRTLNLNRYSILAGRNQTIELYDIILTNGYQGSEGGAIYFRGSGAGSNTPGNANAVDGTAGIVRGSFIIQSSTNSGGSGRGAAIYGKNGGIILDIAPSGSAVFRNNYAGSWGGAIAVYAMEFSALGGPVIFQSNYSASNGGAIAINAARHNVGSDTALGTPRDEKMRYGIVQLDSASLFEENYAGGNGGGISAAGNVILDGQAVFISNTANGNGGAVYSSGSNWIDTGENWFDIPIIVNGTNFTTTWLYGKPNRPARVFDNFEVIASSTFLSNSANNGGAVYVGGTSAKIGANTVFMDNTARANGGAIYIYAGTMALNNITFTDNTSGTSGGALYINTAHVVLGSNNTFSGNKAGINGGLAFINTGTLEIAATDRDMTFQGSEAAGLPNAIGLGVSGNLIVDTGAGGHTVTFLDGIAGGGTDARITHTGNGTLILDDAGGAGLFSTIEASLNLVSGTMKLINASVDWGVKNTGTEGNKATNNIIIGEGAYFYGNGGFYTGIGEISVGDNATLEIPTDSMLAFSANTADGGLITFGTGVSLIGTGTVLIDAANPVEVKVGNLIIGSSDTVPRMPQALTITGGQSSVLIDNGGIISLGIFGENGGSQLIVDKLAVSGSAYLNLLGSESGRYKVIDASGGISGVAHDFILLMNGSAPVGRYAPVLQFENANTEAWIDFLIKNFSMTWIGDTNAIWRSMLDEDNANWTDGLAVAPERYFLNGDQVNFTDSGFVKNIMIADNGVDVADMIVDNTAGNAYTFSGSGGIIASSSNSVVLAASGKLIKKGAGTLGFENVSANIFKGGIELHDGVIAFNDSTQINDGGNGITAYNSGTLRSNAAMLTVGNNLILDSSASALAIETDAGRTLVHTGQISGAGNVSKIGAGTLVLAADSSASFSGVVYANAGNLYVNGGAIDTAVVANNATFGGAGRAGNVTVASGGVLQAGMPGAASALDIDTLDLSAGNAVVNFSILGANQSSSLNVTTLAGLGSGNSMNLSNWIAGTYDLGNFTDLVGVSVITYRGEAFNSRQSYATNIASGSIILTINPTANRMLYWTGTDASVNARWDTPSQSWRDIAGDAVIQFVDYDVVIFDDRVVAAAYRRVNVSNTMAVSSITVAGAGDYTFTGNGSIVASKSGVYGYAGTGTNSKLIKVGAGKLVFDNDSPNLFQGGMDLGATGTVGGTVEFSRADQIATGAGAPIAFLGDATLRAPAGASGVVASNIAIDNNVTATIDVGSGDLALSGSVTLQGAGGTLNKTGGGILRYSGSSTSAGLVTNITGGQVWLEQGVLPGTINLAAANTVLGGYGSASGHVLASANTTILVGYDITGGSNTAGLLYINDLELSANAAIAGSGTLGGSAKLLGTAAVKVAGGDNLVLSGSNTGAGGLIKTGGGNLIYTKASALGYNGGTQIDSGYVMFRGFAGGVTHTITLNGGWLDLSDAGAFDPTGATTQDWAQLTILQGANAGQGGVIGVNDRITLGAGDIASSLRGGLYVVIDAGVNGMATLADSSNYAGYTRIDSGTLSVAANSQLGSAEAQREVILNGGALLVTGTLDTARQLEVRTFGIIDTQADAKWVAITGTGALTKNGLATLRIDAASTAGSLAVNAGHYITSHEQGFGAGCVSVAQGAVVEMRDVVNNGTVPNSFSGSGTLKLTNNIIVLSGSSDISHVNITQTSYVTALGGDSLGNDATRMLIDNSQVVLGALENTLGRITLANNSILGFQAGIGFKRATISSLDGGGILVFNTDLAQGKTDHITINSAPTGHYDIVVLNAGGIPDHSVSGVAYEILSVPAGSAEYLLDGGQVDVGLHVFKLHEQTLGGTTSLSLIGTDFLSRPALYIMNTAGAATLSWFSELDSLQKRFSELRHQAGAKNEFSTWARAYAERYNYGSKATGEPFDETQWGANTGVDYAFRGKLSDIYLGAVFGYGQASRDADIRWGGESKSNSILGGIYATVVNSGGWHVDGVFKYNKFKNNITVNNSARETITGSYDASAIGGSIEVSMEFVISHGWYIRPRVQGAMVVLLATDYQTSNGMNVRLSRGSITQGLVGAQLGRIFGRGAGRFIQPYLNGFGAMQESAGGRLYIDNEEFAPWIKGSRMGGGGGVNWMLSKSTLFYVDYEYSKSDYYKKPWGISIGARHVW